LRITGAAGNREQIDHSWKAPAWTAKRIEDYTFSTMNVTMSELTFTQWNHNPKNPEKVDEFKIHKTK